MTDKTEAQPEALRLELHQKCADFATSLRSAANVVQLEGKNVPPSFLRAADLFEQAASEIQQLKELNARLQPTIEDGSQEWAKCDPAIAFHLIDRHSDNWADAGKMMTEFADAKAELKLKALRDELTAQTNRAAAAEQQVIALTQRRDIANRLNTDARNHLAKSALPPTLMLTDEQCDRLIAALCPDFSDERFPRDRPIMRQLARDALAPDRSWMR